MPFKQVILVRKDLKMPKGKLAAQVAHAALQAALKSDKRTMQDWLSGGGKKVVLSVADEKELLKYVGLAKDASLPAALITDAGHTVVAPGTRTCVGIGPGDEKRVDAVTGQLKMVS